MSHIDTAGPKPRKKIGSKIIAATAALFVGAMSMAAPASADWNPSVGRGIDISGVNPSGTLRLGPHFNETPSIGGTTVENYPLWCIQGKYADPGAGQMTSIATLTDSGQYGPSELDLTTPQMAYLLQKYEGNTGDNTNLAALAYLVHLNFEGGSSSVSPESVAAEIVSATRSQQPGVDALAQQYVSEARASAAVGYEGGAATGDGQRTGNVHGVGVHPDNADVWLAGIPVTATITGPAVFDATGTNTWSGTTASTPISLAWTSTGNGTVTTNITYETKARRTLTKFGANGAVQDMISYGNRPASDPEQITVPGPSWKVIYDFQPVGTSSVDKISDNGSFTDTFDAQADASYGDGQWVQIDGAYVPVVYTATAYYTGTTPAAQSASVPADAEVIGTQTVTANGPGEISASFTGAEAGFATVVWTVAKADQGDNAKYIHGDWADGYGISEETVSTPFAAEINSSLSIRETKAGTYLVDDLFVSGMPDDHGDFAGDSRFSADVKTMTQTLYFFADGVEVSDDNIDQAEKIGEVSVPATNGFYPSVGSTEFKMKDNEAGTYVFVTNFAGDDRVKAMATSVTDVTEQYVVEEKQPTLQTTATDAGDGDKVLPSTGTVTIDDKVCYTDLKPGKEYELTGTLMDKTSEAPIQVDGKDLTATTTFTPEEKDGCTIVTFETDASLLNGKSTVVFERLYQDGKLIAVHTDINDEGQTVETPETPTLKTTATDGKDGDKIITPAKDVKIDDKVCYTNLSAGKTYTLKGILMDQSTNKPVQVDGKDVTGETQFTPSKSDDCTTVTFTFDGSALGGHSTTVFEDAYDGDILVASHTDINDEGQTVKFDQGDKGKGNAGTGLAFTGSTSGPLAVAGGTLLVLGAAAALMARRKSHIG